MNAWSREDIVVAFALYCVTPLNKINPSNKVIQQVAEIIPHSVASIVMRMRNFQFIDPKVSSGLKNVAKADRLIYEEFKHDWGALSLEAETLTGLDLFDSSPLQGAKALSSLTRTAAGALFPAARCRTCLSQVISNRILTPETPQTGPVRRTAFA